MTLMDFSSVIINQLVCLKGSHRLTEHMAKAEQGKPRQSSMANKLKGKLAQVINTSGENEHSKDEEHVLEPKDMTEEPGMELQDQEMWNLPH